MTQEELNNYPERQTYLGIKTADYGKWNDISGKKQTEQLALTKKRLKYLKDCDYVISYAWVRPNGECMSCKNLENFGFELAKELPEYYNNTRSKCKYCWSNCTCVARLYVRTQR
mgnify:CR=1 FL=1